MVTNLLYRCGEAFLLNNIYEIGYADDEEKAEMH